MYARVMWVDAEIEKVGLLDVDPKTKRQHLRPLARLSRDTWQQLSASLSAVGATPSGRVKLAGPRTPGDVSSWDEIA
jgi:hypothetical protein